MRRTVLLALALSSASPALADQPLLRPSRDVDLTYRSPAPRGGEVEQRVRWLAAAQTMRIDPSGSGLHVIIDYVARRMSVVRDAARSVVDMTAPDSMAAMTGGGTASFEVGAEGTPRVLVCIAGDGVLLRAAAEGQVVVSAVSVRYGPQDPAEFRVPADYARHAAGAGR